MIYLVPLAMIVAFLGVIHPKYGLQKNNYKKYIWLCGILIALFAALRTPGVGTYDNLQYTYRYKLLQRYASFKEYYDYRLDKNGFLLSEAGLYFIMWLLGRVFQSGQTIIIVSSIMVTFSTCWFIWRNSRDIPLSLTIYVCLGLFTFNMNGMRQAMAMSICLFAFEFTKKQKLIPFVLTVLLAMQFHRTAMCFIPVFFLQRLKNNRISWFLYIMGLLACLLFVDQIVAGYYQIGGKDYSQGAPADGGGLFVVLLYLGTVVLTIYNSRVLQKQPARIEMLATLAGLTAYLSRYFGIAILERVSYYYFYFPLLLIPEIFQELDDEEYKVIKLIFIIGSVLLFIYRIWNSSFINYKFYFL